MSGFEEELEVSFFTLLALLETMQSSSVFLLSTWKMNALGEKLVFLHVMKVVKQSKQKNSSHSSLSQFPISSGQMG